MDRRRAWAFKTWGTIQTLIEHGSPEVLNLQQHRCENIKSNHQGKTHSTNQLSQSLYLAQQPHKPPKTTDNTFISLFPDVMQLDTIFCYTHV
jgi:hypothetical protein